MNEQISQQGSVLTEDEQARLRELEEEVIGSRRSSSI